MVGIFAAFAVLLGATLAFRAERFQHYRAAVEAVAGWLLIGGFGSLGYALSCAFACP